LLDEQGSVNFPRPSAGSRVQSLAEQTYEIVRRRIIEGAIPPGAPLRQDALALELGVSKIPLREALSRLAQDGLLSMVPRRGYAVRPLSAAEAAEIFALRLALEPAACAEGALKADQESRADAVSLLEALEAADGNAGGAAVTCNRLFHLALLKPAGPLTGQLLERLHALAERYVHVHLEPKGRAARARAEHRALLAAWLCGDGAVVERLAGEHIRRARDELLAELGR
jgi:DNA-binding GntR family transcriptional regulator